MNLACLAAAMLSLSAPGDAAPRGETVLLDFRADWCGPCRQMDPIVGQLAAEGYPVRRVNVDQERALANKFDLRKGIPCFVLLVNGREVDRIVGVTHRNDLEEMFRRNGVGPSVNAARGQSPDSARPSAAAVPFPASNRIAPSTGSGANQVDPFDDQNHSRPVEPRTGLQDRKPLRGSNGSQFDVLLRASVRLKIEDNRGNSIGSGTIIDARAGEALIITCGHVFREAAKGGRIWVDLFGPGAPQGVPGRLIDFDLEAEVGLISIETNHPVKVAQLAPPGYAVRRGDRVISVGCDAGADVTARETHVTALNRYVGRPNLHIAFEPVQGRSGGGLFTPDGLVVGVCYAADPEYKEGAFAALPALLAEMDRAGLEFVYRKDAGSGTLGSVNGRDGSAGWGQFAADKSHVLPRWQSDAATLADSITPTSAKLYQRAPEQLTAEEQTTLDLMRDHADQPEMICLVCPRGNPQAKREIIALDRVPPGLIQQLASQSNPNAPQRSSVGSPRLAASAEFSSAPLGPTTRGNSAGLPPASASWTR